MKFDRKTTKLGTMAQKDAYDWARAEMFFGEGAGTRRKLLWAEINKKISSIPEYKRAFERAYAAQDFAEHAIAAAKERRKIDRLASAGKNFRALKTGNMQNLSTNVFIAAGVIYVVHATGYDKVIEVKAKKLYKKAKTEVAVFRNRTVLHTIHNDTSGGSA